MAMLNFNKDTLDNYKEMLDRYLKRLYGKGLTIDDYVVLEKIRVKISMMKSSVFNDYREYKRFHSYVLSEGFSEDLKKDYLNEESIRKERLVSVDNLLGEYTKVCRLLKKSVVPRSLNGVLNEEGSIFHLAFTNERNKDSIIPLPMSNFMFLCHFHIENHASMQVNDYRGFVHCYGCGIQFNLVEYFMNIEMLTYQEAVNLLAKIYMIDVKNEIYDDNHPLVIKYRNALLDSKFMSLIECSLDKTTSKGENWEVVDTIDKLEKDKELVSRIGSGEHKWYSGKKPDYKVLKLDKDSDIHEKR